MRGLAGNRLLNRWLGSILSRTDFDSSQALDARLDNGAATLEEVCDSKSEKAEETQEAGKPQETNPVISKFAPND